MAKNTMNHAPANLTTRRSETSNRGIRFLHASIRALSLLALTLALPACDTNVGGMENPGGGGNPGGGPAPAASARLFVVGSNANLLSFANPGILLGANVTPSTELENSVANHVIAPKDVAVSQSGILFIANGAGISVFENASTASGPRQADRVVAGPNSEINSPIAVAIDSTNDVLFVSENFAKNAIFVFDNASLPSFDGDPLPDRVISTNDNSFDPEEFAFHAGDLYVVTRDDIFVFANASTLDTMDAVPDRIISGPLLSDPSISIDSLGRLIVTNQNDTILIYNDAATLDGSPAPDLMLTINGAGRLETAVIDSDDRLYAAERNDAVIFSIDAISELVSGSMDADRVIESDELQTPDRLFLFEP